MKFVPKILILPLTYTCNAQCCMCNIWQQKEQKAWMLDDLNTVIDQPVWDDIQAVNLTGGEPVLHPYFNELVDSIICKLRHVNTISLQTNGIDVEKVSSAIEFLVKRINVEIKKKRNLHLDINISIDGPSSIHEHVRGIDGCFNKCIETIKRCQHTLATLPQHALTLNCTVISQNVKYLNEVTQLANKLGVDVSFTFPQSTNMYMDNYSSRHSFALDSCEKKIASKFLHNLLPVLNGSSAMSPRYTRQILKMLNGEKRNLTCSLFKHGLFFDIGGNIYPCWASTDFLLGNILTDSLDVILKKRKEISFSEQLAQVCLDCPSNCYVDWLRRNQVRNVSSISKEGIS